MASVTLTGVADRFAVGATIGAYPLSNWQSNQRPPSGAPQGSSTTTAVVAADGSITFTGLTDNTDYVAVQPSGGTYNYVSFRSGAASSGASSVQDVDVASLPSLPGGTNAIGRVGHDSTGIADNRKTVTTAGTAVALAATTAVKWVIVSALTNNTQQVNVGASTVLAAAGTARGVPLLPGDSVALLVTDLANVYVDSRVNGEGVSFAYGT